MTHKVVTLTRSMSKPGLRAMEQLKQAMGYLKGTLSIGLTYNKDADDGGNLVAYVMQEVRATL